MSSHVEFQQKLSTHLINFVNFAEIILIGKGNVNIAGAVGKSFASLINLLLINNLSLAKLKLYN